MAAHCPSIANLSLKCGHYLLIALLPGDKAGYAETIADISEGLDVSLGHTRHLSYIADYITSKKRPTICSKGCLVFDLQ